MEAVPPPASSELSNLGAPIPCPARDCRNLEPFDLAPLAFVVRCRFASVFDNLCIAPPSGQTESGLNGLFGLCFRVRTPPKCNDNLTFSDYSDLSDPLFPSSPSIPRHILGDEMPPLPVLDLDDPEVRVVPDLALHISVQFAFELALDRLDP